MPRIEADSLEEHVRIQTNRILDAAVALFDDRGYSGTELRDIAGSIGLRRNSLYRYFSNKDHILLACLQREMAPHLARVRKLEQSIPDPRQRVDAWIDLQMQIVTTACHGMMRMAGELSDSSPELRKDIMALHEPLNQVLQQAVQELLRDSQRDAALVGDMIAGMLRAAATRALAQDESAQISEQLKDAVRRVLNTESA